MTTDETTTVHGEDATRPELLPILDEGECADIVARIYDLKSAWTRRELQFPVYSLGHNLYLDGPEGDTYHALISETNPLLRKHFADLHERVRAALATHTGLEVVYDDQLALPGFHVYLAHRLFCTPMASRHFDLQHVDIDWSTRGEADHRGGLSLTLPLCMPKGGAGLRVWDIHYDALPPELTGEDASAFAHLPRHHHHAYALGVAAVHSGHQLHQIAPYAEHDEDNARITLQAHATPVVGPDGVNRLVLYW